MGRGQAEHTSGGIRRPLLAASAATLAASAHAAGGGGLPDASITVVLLGLIAWVAASLADRVRGVSGALVILGAAQLAMHVGLTLLAGHSGHVTGFDPRAMLAAHVVATVLTALLLPGAAHGLAVALSGLRGLLPVAIPPVPPLPPARGRPAVVTPAGPRPIVEVHFRKVCTRRGPPVRS
ncbi:hypothetical protein [Haloechinothrix alba]|uniref:hypothetical protein n=1 Tax=Haloechinothrix alba TaxID=664784 RepID=UPI000B778F8E|nr:hypothetical protein [Haloechinothrix alba]